jgi:DNA-binding FadR family transcriptional regulator
MGAPERGPTPAAALSSLMTEIRDGAKFGDRRADLVLRLVTEALARGLLQPGSRLPTEAELGAGLAISRAPVREAMRVLETIGLVEVRQRAGTVVREGVSGSMAQLLLFETHLRGATIEALTEVRRIFERACAELAAERATERDLEQMRAAIDEMARLAGSADAPIAALAEADAAFHRAVYRATHNPLVESLANFTLTMVLPWMRESLARTGAEQSIALHRCEYDLIAGGKGSEIRGNALSAEADRAMNHWLDSLR